jgi:hypothetical protein
MKIADLIPENDEYLVDIKSCMLSDVAQLTVHRMDFRIS